MAIDLRKDEECRKSLMKHFKDNQVLYGEVDVHIVIAVSDFLLEFDSKIKTRKDKKMAKRKRIERVIELCSDCRYCKQFTELNGNMDFVLICTQNEDDSTSGFMIKRSHNRIIPHQAVEIPDNCPLPLDD